MREALLSFLMIWPLAASGDAPDLAREQRLADQIVDMILDGEPLWLEAGARRFLAIDMPAAQAPARGAVVLLHGRGFHPDWADVIHPLRVGLAEQGWRTLSIQLPVLEKDSSYFQYLPIFPDAIPRIEAALQRAREPGGGLVVVLAHSCATHMVQHWIHNRGDAALEQFDAYIGIGMGATDYGEPMMEPYVLERMPMPVLDLYGTADYPAVRRMAPKRLSLLQQAGNPWSRQVVLAGAEHYFRGHEEALLETVAQWLNTLENPDPETRSAH